jgi:hypothetical protein
VSGLDAAVPEQREEQPNADCQCAETKDEYGETRDGRKGPEVRPGDEAKQGGRS